ncbi:hypothetical protein [Oceanithermus sp.]
MHEHYLHFFRTEWAAYERAVTDWRALLREDLAGHQKQKRPP